MTQRTIAGGAVGAERMREAHREWLDSRHTVTRCAACGETLHRGPAADGREAARTHREARHPELAVAARRRLTPEQQRAMAMARSEWRRRKFQGED